MITQFNSWVNDFFDNNFDFLVRVENNSFMHSVLSWWRETNICNIIFCNNIFSNSSFNHFWKYSNMDTEIRNLKKQNWINASKNLN